MAELSKEVPPSVDENGNPKYLIRTLSLNGTMRQTTINLSEHDAHEKFMDQFGYEPGSASIIYTDGVFVPGRFSSCPICDDCL